MNRHRDATKCDVVEEVDCEEEEDDGQQPIEGDGSSREEGESAIVETERDVLRAGKERGQDELEECYRQTFASTSILRGLGFRY